MAAALRLVALCALPVAGGFVFNHQHARFTTLRSTEADAEEDTGLKARRAAMAAVFEAQALQAKESESELSPAEIKAREAALYERNRDVVVGDHFFLGALVSAALWRFASLKAVESYALGVAFGGAYLYLLARYVGSIGEATLDGAKEGGIGQARFAIVGLLVAIAGKNRDYVDFIPLLVGFFSYQAATLLQAFRPPDVEA